MVKPGEKRRGHDMIESTFLDSILNFSVAFRYHIGAHLRYSLDSALFVNQYHNVFSFNSRPAMIRNAASFGSLFEHPPPPRSIDLTCMI